MWEKLESVVADLLANLAVVGFMSVGLLLESVFKFGADTQVDSAQFIKLLDFRPFIAMFFGVLMALCVAWLVVKSSKLRSQKRRGECFGWKLRSQLSSLLAGFGSLSLVVAFVAEAWIYAVALPICWLVAVVVAPPLRGSV